MSQGSIAMRLRSTGECVDLALLWLREDFSLFLRVGWPGWLVSLLASLLVWAWEPWLGLGTMLFLGPLVQAPLITVGAARAAGQPPTMSFRSSLNSIFLLLGWELVLSLFGMASLVMPPLTAWLLVQGTFFPEVLLVEQSRQIQPVFTRISELGNRISGRAVQARLWQGAIFFWGGLAGEFVGQAVVRDLFQSGEPFGTLMAGDLTPYLLVGLWLAMPLWALFRFVLYLDIRTRSESLDVFFSLWTAAGRPRE